VRLFARHRIAEWTQGRSLLQVPIDPEVAFIYALLKERYI
jgi:hypothetical protein